MVMWLIAELSKETLILSILVEVVDSTDNKVDHDFLETPLVVHPLLGVGVLIEEVIKDLCSKPWWVLRESNWPVWAGRGLRVKVNLPIFKDEKTKDAVTYCLWL